MSVDILRHLKGDRGCLATTLVDYYALPSTGAGAWPGRAEAAGVPFPAKADMIQSALKEDITKKYGAGFNENRFIPFVVIHEFEGLLFSDCKALAQSIGRPELEEKLQNIRSSFSSPEEINDSPVTAPSKRLAEALGGHYEKPLFGTLAALGVGLNRIRSECPNFNTWMLALEECSS